MARDAHPIFRGHAPAIGGMPVLINPASSSSNQWYGVTVVACGMQTTIATTLVNTDTTFALSLEDMIVNSENVPQFRVKSITPGVNFIVGASSFSLTNSFRLHWMMMNPSV